MQPQMTIPEYRIPSHLRKYFRHKTCGSCYVCHLVRVFRGVKRVLRDDGVLWLNIGDTYYGGKGASNYAFQRRRTSSSEQKEYHNILAGKGEMRPQDAPHPFLKPKDLVGIPWRVSFALQADGWYLRNAVVWHKPNTMPQSVKDRLTCSYEHIFLLTKSKKYFFDAEAIMEDALTNVPCKTWKEKAYNQSMLNKKQRHGVKGRPSGVAGYSIRGKKNKRDVWTIPTKPGQWDFCYNCKTVYEGKQRRKIIKKGKLKVCPECGCMDKWVDHFAMFPPDLVEPCILAGTSEKGCCPQCGAPWRRVVQKGESDSEQKWEPSCSCGDSLDPIPCTVLDLFCGSANTGVVATKLGRIFIGIDIKDEYACLSRARLENMGAMG